jgi:ABC-type lipoprotein export system ATPase subunit
MLTNEVRIDLTKCAEFFRRHQLPPPHQTCSLEEYWDSLSWQQQELDGWTLPSLEEALTVFIADDAPNTILTPPQTLEILPGVAKDGTPETFRLVFRPGDVVSIVGPTGSGKSRLLADIECLAQGDTPSRRKILIDGQLPSDDARFTNEGRLVAQISQNMNFVMDLAVGEFLHLHAASRGAENPSLSVSQVLASALAMAGEAFTAETPLTQLSGGQSRALMIADAAILSPKPIVLIDEIENAGVDRLQALKLFADQGKILLLSTHDPLLALSAQRRLVICNGAIAQIIESTPYEKAMATELEASDRQLKQVRDLLRGGWAWA